MRRDDPARMERMREWLRRVADELGVEPEAVLDHEEDLLDMVSAVAHGPSRPGAPLSAFLIGVAVGRGAAASEAAGRVSVLAQGTDAAEGPAQSR
ncbi:MAG: DUF6457 domain-containing protein [Micropruina sp.]|uniref:DUF6457 domain-containing protein n=1 Tax=Micropruina sp. TaxID=2737536 RepID=UPI0039E6A81C